MAHNEEPTPPTPDPDYGRVALRRYIGLNAAGGVCILGSMELYNMGQERWAIASVLTGIGFVVLGSIYGLRGLFDSSNDE